MTPAGVEQKGSYHKTGDQDKVPKTMTPAGVEQSQALPLWIASEWCQRR